MDIFSIHIFGYSDSISLKRHPLTIIFFTRPTNEANEANNQITTAIQYAPQPHHPSGGRLTRHGL